VTGAGAELIAGSQRLQRNGKTGRRRTFQRRPEPQQSVGTATALSFVSKTMEEDDLSHSNGSALRDIDVGE
jgi:hypothetical protein